MTDFEDETLVAHGCATHDFNLVSETEIDKVIDALQKSLQNITYSGVAGRSGRLTFGSVQVLFQRFGDSVLLVTTRSPQRTEDLDFSIGMTIMAEGHRWFPHVAVVDAHNCMTDLSSPYSWQRSPQPSTRRRRWRRWTGAALHHFIRSGSV